MAKKRRFHYGFVILIGVAVVRGFSGPAINSATGLFLKIAADDFGVGIGTLSLYFSISAITTVCCLPLCGKLLNKYNAKFVALMGVLLQTIAFMVQGRAASVWTLYLCAVPMAIGMAILVNLLGPVLLNRWFVSHKGLVMGGLMTITSLMGAVLQPLLTGMIGAMGWRQTCTRFGTIALFIMVAAALLLRSEPGVRGMQPFGSKTQPDKERRTAGITRKQAVKTLAFYMLLLFLLVLTGFSSFSQHITTYGLELGFSMETVGKALSISMVGSAVGAIAMGVCNDKIGPVKTSLGVLGVGVGAVVLFLFGSGSFWLFAGATFLHGLATAAVGVISPVLTAAFFGYQDYEKIYALVMTGSPLASIVLLPAYGFLYDRFGSYRPVFVCLLGALAVGAVALCIGRKSCKKLQMK